ncbi:Transferase [Parasponia andersonii]|uniref:Transferase n=1 Tax=Parasponia andersonii TaxID=3476 RepID=A0A2P5ACB2_PARAD|nr:Transferase [Parasponia andersonii]
MVNMEVTIFSRETIKPSNVSSLDHLKPPKICLFDQLTPVTYPEVLLFYSICDPNLTLHKTLFIQLKKSLSETLTLFYPFSGRTKNNLYIDDFDAGVPYSEARVNCRMSDYLQLRETESLNKFVAFHPFSKEGETSGPQLAIQVNLFTCGGIALGVSVCHKKSDGATLSHFLKSWAALTTRAPDRVVPPDLSKAATLFPPLTDLPSNSLALMDQLCPVPDPKRRRELFHMEARHGGLLGRVGLAEDRHRGPRRQHEAQNEKVLSLENCTGNLFWWASIVVNPAEKAKLELSQLVALTSEMVAEFNGEYLETMVGEAGFEPVSEFVNQLEAMLSLESEKPDIFAFTNWKSFFNEVDFGFGNPVWVGAHGKVGSELRNLIILIDSQGSNDKEIEAFVTLEDRQMAVLESDSKFLAFAWNSKSINSSL